VNENQLDQMPVDQLIELKSRIEKMIEARIKREREALLRKLDAIRGYEAMTAKSVNGAPHAMAEMAKRKDVPSPHRSTGIQ